MISAIKRLIRRMVGRRGAIRVAGLEVVSPQKWDRPTGGGFQDLPEEQVKFMWETSSCPYCHSSLYGGPEGGLSKNMFCGNPDCNSRFNVTMPGLVGFPGAGSSPVPAWGEFTGECPDDFLEFRRREIEQQKADAPLANYEA